MRLSCRLVSVQSCKARLLPALVLMALSAKEASAYTDPGSGALLWQMLVAGFVGCVFYLRKLLYRIRSGRRDSEN
jgi:hypothetical protein